MTRYFLLMLALLGLSACEAAPTPVPVAPQATSTSANLATQAPPLRIGITADTINYVDNLAALREDALVQTIAATDDLTTYDLVFGYGVRDGWERGPTAHTVSLVINPQLAPLNQDAIADLLRQSLNTQALSNATAITGVEPQIVAALSPTAFRTALANAGFPDGLTLLVAHTEFHALSEAQAQFSALAFYARYLPVVASEVRSLLMEQQAHLALVQWWDVSQRAEWVDLVGEDNVLDLYKLPISYRTTPDLAIDFSPAGWPLPQRPTEV